MKICMAQEILKVAKSLVAYDDALRDINDTVVAYLNRVPGVASAVMNDFGRLSEGVYSVDFHVYGDPKIGGKLSRRLKSQVMKLGRNDNIEVDEFWTPRSDRSIAEVGVSGLLRFYERNPWKVTLIIRT